jgi:hypothetical protein
VPITNADGWASGRAAADRANLGARHAVDAWASVPASAVGDRPGQRSPSALRRMSWVRLGGSASMNNRNPKETDPFEGPLSV